MKNNILFISRAYGEYAGGMERLSFELIQAFPSPALTIVNKTRSGQSLFVSRLQSIIFAITVLPRALFLAKNVDVIHLGDPVLLFVGWCIRVVYKKPIICTVHGLDVSFQHPLYQAYLNLFLRVPTEFISISDFSKQLLQKKNVSQYIAVIPPGIIDRNYDESITRKNLEQVVGQNLDNKIVIATTGRLIARKGHAWFIEHVLPHLPHNVVYCIAGSGPEQTSIEATIECANMQEQVLLLGRISDAEQKILLNTCDAFIQPNIHISFDYEGFGIAPLEASLCARNVFASHIDGLPSAIIDGKNGTLLPCEDANTWITALTAYCEHPSISIQAREYTKKEFSWERIALQYREVFERVI